jgi:superfamily II DNA or RNA helicase
VDIIIALGMAKEGFDWIWCEHALTIGYRSSLTEIVQIIGRATRDAEGKDSRALHQPDRRARRPSKSAVAEAVNDMLKAIAASLLMEQVLAPRYEFTPKNAGAQEGFDYGDDGYVDRQEPRREQGDRSDPHRDQRAGQRQEQGSHTHLPGRPERGHRQFIQDKTGLERGCSTRNWCPRN